MPEILNVIEAVKYKQSNPDRRVWYSPNYMTEGMGDYYEENLVLFRGEAMFELDERFNYPEYFDHEDFETGNFYLRHITEDISAETDEEYALRHEKELDSEKEKELKRKKKLKADIKRKQKELEELEKSLDEGK